MDKLQLALLTKWAEDANLGGIKGRKRMQKVIYFLKQAGCPIYADYTLHHYGPYSSEVANVTDVMVAEGLLNEQSGSGMGGGQYDYTLGSNTRGMIERIGDNESIISFKNFHKRAVELLNWELRELELGSTILYFYHSQHPNQSWDSAFDQACKYKRADSKNPISLAALKLAQRFAGNASERGD
ncbi:MAG: hypothetical protein R3B58_05540 [Phycisphaerales bacterium]|nr:hypothetical protein [Phycisphaerales bacterium]